MRAPVKHTILHLKNKIGDKILRINVLKSRLFRRDKSLSVILRRKKLVVIRTRQKLASLKISEYS